MYRGSKALVAALLIPASVLVSSCGRHSDPSALDCQTDEQCPSTARCTGSGCVANSPPVASFAVTGELQVNALVKLDGSASSDPDAEDAVTSYVWSLESDGAACAPPQVASTEPSVLVRFGCLGRYRARLVVLDGKQAKSAPATRLLEVGAGSGATAVDAGPDQVVEHACTGSPLSCHLASAVRLSATSSAPAGTTFRWSVEPPSGRPLDARRRVRFTPDETAQSPAVEIETDGTAISGDWLFRVEVRDGVGTLGADVMRLSVGNRPPAIRGGPPLAFDHGFVAASQLFTAEGSFPVEVVDEDGDPVVRQVAFHHAGDGGAVFQGEDLGAALRFVVAVPRAVPADALHLTGAEGLERSVAFTATDANGASTSATFSVAIGNRAPALVGTAAGLAPHTFDRATQRYLSDAGLGTWRDPDGDPLELAVDPDDDCTSSSLDAAGGAWFHCARPFSGLTSLASFLRARSATVRVRDPWITSEQALSFQIANRAPVASSNEYSPTISCRFGQAASLYCPGTGSAGSPGNLFPAATVYPIAAVVDPDGDPLEVRPSSGGFGGTCLAGAACPLTIFLPQSASCDLIPPRTSVPFAVTDGVASSTAQVQISPACH